VADPAAGQRGAGLSVPGRLDVQDAPRCPRGAREGIDTVGKPVFVALARPGRVRIHRRVGDFLDELTGEAERWFSRRTPARGIAAARGELERRILLAGKVVDTAACELRSAGTIEYIRDFIRPLDPVGADPLVREYVEATVRRTDAMTPRSPKRDTVSEAG